MMLRRVSTALTVLSLALVGGFHNGTTQAAPAAAIPGQYIVVFKDSVADPTGNARGLAAQHGLSLRHTYGAALKGFAATIPAARLALLRGNPDIAYIVPDEVVSLGPITAQGKPGGGGGSTSQTLPTGIDRIDGDLSLQRAGNGSGVVTGVAVAVIDTGIASHPDLNVVGGFNCSTGTSYADGNGHGSHVAGTIGARDNNIGVVGVAPGVPLYAVRVLNNAGSGTRSDVICGIDWVTKNAKAKNIVAANMSLGGSGSDDGNCGKTNNDPEHTAVCNLVSAGVTLAVAAGNETDDAKNHVPAAYDEAITVSALADFDGKPGGGAAPTCRADVDDTFADFSNYGADVDFIAPGVCIYSTWKGGGYNTISGTSMATPHVTGAAALYIFGHPGATPADVKAALQSAGTLNWNNGDDHDGTKERLLNVATY